MQLIEKWRNELFRLWSLRFVYASGAVWAAVGGLWVLWPALIEELPPWIYFTVGLSLAVATGVARVTKQPGADE